MYAFLCFGLKEIDTNFISLACNKDYHENLSWLQSSITITHRLLDQVKPCVEFSTKLEFKPLPKILKYVYVEKGEKLPVVIANNFNVSQEERSINVLKQNKMAIGWTYLILEALALLNVCITDHLLSSCASNLSAKATKISAQSYLGVFYSFTLIIPTSNFFLIFSLYLFILLYFYCNT